MSWAVDAAHTHDLRTQGAVALKAPKSEAEILAEMALFSVRTCSVLVDDSTDQAMIQSIPAAGIEGYYSFTAAVAGKIIKGCTVQLLPLVACPPASQAWLLATNSKAGYALNEYLREQRQDDKIVLTLARERVSPMYSYVDFFHGETSTIAYISNNFERGYKIHFSIAVRFLLRSQTGEIRKCGQWLIAPNQTIAFDSRKIGLAQPFVGFLELYADIRHLNGEVSEFLHFNCDYLSDSGIAVIHQSGFKPWPAGSRFIRGIVPTDGQSQLTTSLFNKEHREPIVCQAELRYTRNNERLSVRKELPPIAKYSMAFVNINELFSAQLVLGAEAADIVIVPDKPMHRPNFYLHPCVQPWAWTAVEHGAALCDQLLSPDRQHDLVALDALPWICIFPILPERFEIDTIVLYFQEGVARLHEFTFEIYDHAGTKLHCEDVRCEFGARINISDWAQQRSFSLDGGLLKISPSATAKNVPHSFSFLQGFQSRHTSTFSVGVSGGAALNIPFEWERGGMWDHPMVPIVHTEQFGKAIVDDEFDTIVTLTNASSMLGYNDAADLEFDVYAADGRKAHFRKTIAPNTTIAFSIGELIIDSDLPRSGHFALWMYCRNRSIQGFHILQRKKDCALGAQHFYYCRFNIFEPDTPSQQEITASQFGQPERTSRKLARAALAGIFMLQRAIGKFMR